ncbi:hypothetical protein TNCV_1714231 [Trichonephila clavipes]|nr:hypothetical protein TNCV_1714231 [Trichonephila clavipes]
MNRSLVGRFEQLGSMADRPGRSSYRNIRYEVNVKTVRQISSRTRRERRKRFVMIETVSVQWWRRILICGFNKMEQMCTLLCKL